MSPAATFLDTDRLELSEHARRRFRERLRPTLEHAAAASELRNLVAAHGVLSPEPPAWLAGRQRAEPPADLYVIVGEEIVLPVRRSGGRFPRFVAITCLTRTGISELARSHRNARGQARRARRRARREGGRRSERRRTYR